MLVLALFLQIFAFAAESDAFQRLGIEPFGEWQLSKEKTAVNLETYDEGLAILSPRSRDPLRIATFRKGVLATETRTVRLGLGPALNTPLNFSPLPSPIALRVGLMPLVGKSMHIVQWKAHPKDSFHVVSLHGPELIEEIQKEWQTDDEIHYAVLGGLIYQAGLGTFPLSVDGQVLAEGEWAILVKKISEDKVFLSITKERLHSLSVNGHLGLLVLSKEHFRKVEESFSYEIDLAREEGRAIFSDLLRGNLAGVSYRFLQTTAAQKTLSHSERRAHGNARKWSAQLPFLIGMEGSESKISQKEDKVEFADGSHGLLESELYVHVKERKILAKDTQLQEIFYGGIATQVDGNGRPMEDSWQSEFTWNYQASRLDTEDLKRVFYKLAGTLGFLNLFALDVPLKHERLGYSRVQFTMRISQEVWEKTLENVPSKKSENRLLGLFAELSDLQKKGKPFLKKIPEIGRVIFQSPENFHQALKLFGEGVTLNYLVEGERIARYELRLITKKDYTFAPVHVPDSSRWTKKTIFFGAE